MLRRQRGLGLVEMMVALVAGMILVAGIISLFVAVIRANTTSMQSTRLSQELQAVMEQISRDVQRAGYSATAANQLVSGGGNNYQFNPTTDLKNSAVVNGTTIYRCLILNYDSANGVRVYRLDLDSYNKNAIILGSSNDCTGGNAVTISNEIEIIDFTISLNPSSLVTGARALDITLMGRSVANTNLTMTLMRTVKLRNDGV